MASTRYVKDLYNLIFKYDHSNISSFDLTRAITLIRVIKKIKDDLNATLDNDDTVLACAAENGHRKIVELLLEAKADPAKPGYKGVAPLTWAASRGHTDVVKTLLEEKANLNQVDERNTPALTHAAMGGHNNVVNVLIEAKADPNQFLLPLTGAVLFKQHKTVQLLLDKKADPNKRNEGLSMPLKVAITKDSHETAKCLLAAKADIDHLDNEKKSAIDHAIENNNLAMVHLLIHYDPTINDYTKLYDYLSSQDQHHPLVKECLKKINPSPPDAGIELTSIPVRFGL